LFPPIKKIAPVRTEVLFQTKPGDLLGHHPDPFLIG
jgi:hypothetical protein